MCRNIRILFNFAPPVTETEIRAASLQFVRKISGFNKPSKANEAAFEAAVDATARRRLPRRATGMPLPHPRASRDRRRHVSTAANIVVAVVALIHVYILILEMFLWDKPAGLRAFGQTQQVATASKVLAANQGLYNGFLAAGLAWGLWLGPNGTSVKVFFLGCVLVAGLYGAASASRKILYVQAIPAAIGLALIALS